MKKSDTKNKKRSDKTKQYTIERMKDLSSNRSPLVDTLLDKSTVEEEKKFERKSLYGGQRLEFTVFKHEEYRECTLIPREIENLQTEIRKEIEAMKKTNQQFETEVQEIEKATFDTLPKKSGVYHVKFLELMLSLIRTIREKVGEGRTWLNAMKSKKKKRGSLFTARAQKKGTQYSLSQELQNSRSVM